MMAPAHSLSGALAGLGLASLLGPDTDWRLRLVVVADCCGSALLPDLDHPGATASRSLGFITGALSDLTAGVCRVVYRHTRGPRDKVLCGFRHRCVPRRRMVWRLWWRGARREPPRRCGTIHRTATHTIPGCVVLGVIAAAVTACGQVPALAILGLLAALGADGAPVIGVTFTLATIGAASQVPHLSAWWWVWGVTVMIGCVVHREGDWLTTRGVPLHTWPREVDGKRWSTTRLPVLSFDAGAWPERLLIAPALIVGCGWLGLVVFT